MGERKRRRRRRNKEEEMKKKSRFGSLEIWNLFLEFMFGNLEFMFGSLEFMLGNFLFMFGTLVWNFCMDLLVRKPSKFSLCLCLGFEEPYLCIKVICVGFSSVCWLVLRWVSFGWRIFGENGQTGHFCRNRR